MGERGRGVGEKVGEVWVREGERCMWVRGVGERGGEVWVRGGEVWVREGERCG